MEDKLYIRGLLVVLLVVGGLITLGTPFLYVEAYSPYRIHHPLSERAVELFNRAHPDKYLSDTEKRWIAEGSAEEDAPVARVLRHFYDPINNAGLQGYTSALRWAHDAQLQSAVGLGGVYTWEAAIGAYNKGDKEYAYRALGHVLHLVQDASVPAHTRQDPHPPFWEEGFGGEDPYEHAVEEKNVGGFGGLSIPRFSSLDRYLHDLAYYTNTHFLSHDSVGLYELPRASAIEGEYIYAVNGGDKYKIAKGVGNAKFFSGKDLEIDLSDPLVVNDYWERLAPRAVASSAGVIALFEDSIIEPEPPKKEEGNWLKRGMSKAKNVAQSTWNNATDIARSVSGTARLAYETAQFAATNFRLDAQVHVGMNSFADVNVPFVGSVSLQRPDISADIARAITNDRSAGLQVFARQVSGFAPPAPQAAADLLEDKSTLQQTPPEAEHEEEAGVREEGLGGQEENGLLVVVTKVVDGDTIEIEGGRQVRYIGVDTPELSAEKDSRLYCLAQTARDRNQALVEGKMVRLERGPDDTDVYGRLLRYVWADEQLVSEVLIEEGYGYAQDFGFTHVRSSAFVQVEQNAQEEQRGLWGDVCTMQKEEEEEEESDLDELIESEETEKEEHEQKDSEPLEPSPLLISEVKTHDGEFFELYNPTNEVVSLAQHYFAYYSSTRTSWDDPYIVKAFPHDAHVEPGKFFLVALGDVEFPIIQAHWRPYETERFAKTKGTLAVFVGDPRDEYSLFTDAFGWGEVHLAEYNPYQEELEDGEAFARVLSHQDIDNDNNAFDFSYTAKPTPGWWNEIMPRRPKEDTTRAQEPAEVVISEVSVNGVEFIELYNATNESQDLSQHYLAYYPSSRTSLSDPLSRKKLPDGATIAPHGYYVIALADYDMLADAPPAHWQPDAFSALANGAGTVALFPFDPTTTNAGGAQTGAIDVVGWGGVVLSEGMPAEVPGEGESISRDSAATDTHNNSEDFSVMAYSPASSSAVLPAESAEEEEPVAPADHLLINEIQLADIEFVELYNPTDAAIDLSSYFFTYYSSSRDAWSDPHRIQQFLESSAIAAQGYYLIGLEGTFTHLGNPSVDWQPYTSAQLSNSQGTVAVFESDPRLAPHEGEVIFPVDAVAWGAITSELREGTPAKAPQEGMSIGRDEEHGDRDDNQPDFTQQQPTPTNRFGQTYREAFTGAPLLAQWQYDERNSGQASVQGPASVPSVMFETALSANPSSKIVLVDSDGNSYVSVGSTLYSIALDGTVRWEYPFAGDAALSHDSAYLYLAYCTGGFSPCYFATIDTGTGQAVRPAVQIAYFAQNGGPTTPAIGGDGTVYVATVWNVFAFNSDGTQRWQDDWKEFTTAFLGEETLGEGVTRISGLAVADGRVYILVNYYDTADPDGWVLVAFSVGEGVFQWYANTGRTYAQASIASDGRLFVGRTWHSSGPDHYGVTAFDSLNTGAFVGETGQLRKSNSRIIDPPTHGPDGRVYTRSSDGEYLHVLESFDVVYSFNVSEVFGAEQLTTVLAVDADNVVYAGGNNGAVYAFSVAGSGVTILWQYDVGEAIYALGVVEGRVYVLTEAGRVVGL